MDSLITAAGRALAAGDILGALKLVAFGMIRLPLRFAVLRWRNWASVRAKALLRSAARSFDPREAVPRSYPMLTDLPITHDWSGPIDRTPNSLPVMGRLGGRPHIVYGVGWSGNGVGPSVIGGKVLASLALERDDDWSRHPLVGRSAGRFPPEPIRWMGAHIVRGAVARKERAEAEERRPSRIDVALSGLAPAGLEDKTSHD